MTTGPGLGQGAREHAYLWENGVAFALQCLVLLFCALYKEASKLGDPFQEHVERFGCQVRHEVEPLEVKERCPCTNAVCQLFHWLPTLIKSKKVFCCTEFAWQLQLYLTIALNSSFCLNGALIQSGQGQWTPCLSMYCTLALPCNTHTRSARQLWRCFSTSIFWPCPWWCVWGSLAHPCWRLRQKACMNIAWLLHRLE